MVWSILQPSGNIHQFNKSYGSLHANYVHFNFITCIFSFVLMQNSSVQTSVGDNTGISLSQWWVRLIQDKDGLALLLPDYLLSVLQNMCSLTVSFSDGEELYLVKSILSASYQIIFYTFYDECICLLRESFIWAWTLIAVIFKEVIKVRGVKNCILKIISYGIYLKND